MPFILIVAVAFATAPARADDAGLDPARNEVSVFGGISILDARSSCLRLLGRERRAG